MTSSSSPPVGLESEAGAAMLAPPGTTASPARPRPAASTVADNGEITALAAVTGILDDVGDVLEPGCFRRSLRIRNPRMVVGHEWGRVAGRATEVTELMPGDPRLPKRTPRGEPWPPEAGALLVKATFLPTREGQEARAVAQAFGADHAFSIGYMVKHARQRRGIRHIDDLDLYEFSPVLHGANRLATTLSVKASRPARLELKATSGDVRRPRRPASHRAARHGLRRLRRADRGRRAGRACGRRHADLPRVRRPGGQHRH